MTDRLFGTWLNRTRYLQVHSFGRDPVELEGDDRVEFIRWNTLAAVDELMEMLGEVGWKPWATSRHVNSDAAAAEIVDVMHFLANMLLAYGWDDNKLDEYYARKMDKNRDRMASGTYDGITGKCRVCRRALDDENVTCTEMECANV